MRQRHSVIVLSAFALGVACSSSDRDYAEGMAGGGATSSGGARAAGGNASRGGASGAAGEAGVFALAGTAGSDAGGEAGAGTSGENSSGGVTSRGGAASSGGATQEADGGTGGAFVAGAGGGAGAPIVCEPAFTGDECAYSRLQWLGIVSGDTTSQATAVSGDGSLVVGFSSADTSDSYLEHGFRWTLTGGLRALPEIKGGHGAAPRGISADGSTLVGYVLDTEGYSNACRWTAPNFEISLLAPVPGDLSHARARGASADGAVIVGTGADEMPFRWTAATGFVSLGYVPHTAPKGPPDTTGEAVSVSDDGTVIIGRTGFLGFSWTQTHLMTGFGDLVANRWVTGGALTPDGLTIFANASSYDLGPYAFVPGKSGAPQILSISSVAAVSAGGKYAVGDGLWDASSQQLRTFAEVVAALGIELGADTLDYANGISRDGKVIVGSGTHNGQSRGFVLMLP